MMQRKPLIRFAKAPKSVELEAFVGEPKFEGNRFHCRIPHEICTLSMPLIESAILSSRKVLVGRFNDCMEFMPLIEGRDAVSLLISKAMDNYIKAYADLGGDGQGARARVLGERIKAMKILEDGADYALNLPGAFLMVSAITVLLDFSVHQSLDVGYYEFSSHPLRTAVNADTNETCLMLPGGISIAIRPKS